MDFLWLELLNSDWHDYLGRRMCEDRLDKPEWLRGFLDRWELPAQKATSRDTRERLRALRSLLQRLVRRYGLRRAAQAHDLAELNSYLSAGPVVRKLEREVRAYRMRLVPKKVAIGGVLAEIAASFAEVLIEGDPSRIKICENPDCKWVFYDHSKSRTRRWCAGPSACGNLMKVRRFRARQNEGGDRASTRKGKRKGSTAK